MREVGETPASGGAGNDAKRGGAERGGAGNAKRGGLRPWWWAGGVVVIVAVVSAALRFLGRTNSDTNVSGYVVGVLITLGFAVAGVLLVLLVARIRAARLRFEGPIDTRALLAALTTEPGIRRGIATLHPVWVLLAIVPGSMLALAGVGAFLDGQPIPAIVMAVIVLGFGAALAAIAVATRRGLARAVEAKGYLARIVTVPTQLPGTALRVYVPVDGAGEVGPDVEGSMATFGRMLPVQALAGLAHRENSLSLLNAGITGWPPLYGLTDTRDRPFVDGLWLVVPRVGHGGATISARAYGVRVGALSRHVQRGGIGRRATRYDIRP